MRGKPKITLDEYAAMLPRAALLALLADVNATRGEIPCERHDRVGGCCEEPPEAHETCRSCFCWRDCTDPECDHPACGRGPHWRFRKGVEERWPRLLAYEIRSARGEAQPAATAGRMPVLVEEVEPDEKLGRKALEALTRAQGEWLQLYEVGGIPAERQLNAEVWLVKAGIPVEECTAVYQDPVWAALAVITDEPIRGGMHVSEFRLAEALPLDAAPEGSQGSLF